MASFGVSLPVIALNNGFLGAVSRIGKLTITARQVLSTSAKGPNFGDPCVIVPGAANVADTIQSVADYITAGGTFTAAKFAGTAVREVKTNLSFVAMESLGTFVGGYAPGEIAELCEEGSVTVKINNGAPISQAPVYVRTVLNAAIPAGVVGGFEAVADGVNTIQLTGVVFRTGVLDSNGVAEITILNRVAA